MWGTDCYRSISHLVSGGFMAGKTKPHAKSRIVPKKRRMAKSGQEPPTVKAPTVTREDLGARFTEAVLSEFERHGGAALEEVRKKRPWDFLRFVSAAQTKAPDPLNDSEPMTYDQIRSDLLNDLRDLAHTGVDLHALVDEALAGMAADQPA
jgi:hypothetical protein